MSRVFSPSLSARGTVAQLVPPTTMNKRFAISFFVALLLLLGLGVREAVAQEAARQAALVLRILSYDRNLPQRVSNRVTILVAYRAGNAESEGEQRRITEALNQLRRVNVAGMPARAVATPYTNRAGLMQTMQSERAAAVYVCRGLDNAVSEISAATRGGRVLSMSSDGGAVRRGLGVGLIENGNEIQLLVNLRAVEAEGARLDAAVLRLAEVIR
jgi:hypothetical protein